MLAALVIDELALASSWSIKHVVGCLIMQSILRQIVAGPRARHPEANLDLCYVTDNIIATSGPAASYPSLAYRTPLHELVSYLDQRHGEDWCIWEFRAEGTGYPDSEVYDRIWHFPWPDHHPPPFALVPRIMASMRDWLQGAGLDSKNVDRRKKRVVVVHCKAGKGRSGSMAISYLVTHEGWKLEDAMQRFTERRMRPGFGPGISIPSQKRWLTYVDRWANHGGRLYVERSVEVTEVHIWGLREGTKVEIEGYVEDGRKIKSFHTFTASERDDVGSNILPSGAGSGAFADAAASVASKNKLRLATYRARARSKSPAGSGSSSGTAIPRTATVTPATPHAPGAFPSSDDSSTQPESLANTATPSQPQSDAATPQKDGLSNVIFRPSKPVILPTSDVNLAVEQRKGSKGWTTVTSVGHVWFNCYFEGNGPETWQKQHTSRSSDDLVRVDTSGRSSMSGNQEKQGQPQGAPQPDDSGVFTIEWDAMDGIKGSSRKGTRAFDKVAVVWKAVAPTDTSVQATDIDLSSGKQAEEALREVPSIVIPEPEPDQQVSPTGAANWRGSKPFIEGIEAEAGEQGADASVEEESESEDGVKGMRRGLVGAKPDHTPIQD